jgi:L-asparaginase
MLSRELKVHGMPTANGIPLIRVVVAGGNINLPNETGKPSARTHRDNAQQIRVYLSRLCAVPPEGDSVDLPVRDRNLGIRTVRAHIESFDADWEDGDSSGFGVEHWNRLAQHIWGIKEDEEKNMKVDTVDGFVVLHGLDTMAYSASALSFVFPDLSFPIVMTGSQRRISDTRTDAVQNIISAVMLAAARSGTAPFRPQLPEVTVFCADILYRGNRIVLSRPPSYRSFDSGTYPPLATVGEYIHVDHARVLNRNSVDRLGPPPDIKECVRILEVHPGITRDLVLRHFAVDHLPIVPDETECDPTLGLLIRTYGMGTAPTKRNDFLIGIRDLVKRGIVVANVPQAATGHLSLPQDPVTLRLLEHGVIYGLDMTTEAAYTKLSVLLTSNANLIEVRRRLQLNRVGELSRSVHVLRFSDMFSRTQDPNPLGKREKACYLRRVETAEEVEIRTLLPEFKKNDRILEIHLRLLGVKPLREENADQEQTLTFAYYPKGRDKDNEPYELVSTRIAFTHETGSSSGSLCCTENIALDIFDNSNALHDLSQPECVLKISVSHEHISWERCEIAVCIDSYSEIIDKK